MHGQGHEHTRCSNRPRPGVRLSSVPGHVLRDVAKRCPGGHRLGLLTRSPPRAYDDASWSLADPPNPGRRWLALRVIGSTIALSLHPSGLHRRLRARGFGLEFQTATLTHLVRADDTRLIDETAQGLDAMLVELRDAAWRDRTRHQVGRVRVRQLQPHGRAGPRGLREAEAYPRSSR